jgi:beta-N-acetylhexosaminidase
LWEKQVSTVVGVQLDLWPPSIQPVGHPGETALGPAFFLFCVTSLEPLMKMSTAIPLRDSMQEAPYNLKIVEVDWVYKAFEGLSNERKLAQLFNIFLAARDPKDLQAIAQFQPGAVTVALSSSVEDIQRAHSTLAEHSELPVLVSADLEGGAIQMACFTPLTNPLGMAAAAAGLYEQGVDLMAQEAALVGINWAFAPAVDINKEFRSAITATRSYGSSAAKVEAMAHVYMKSMQSHGVAATAKHWPGEGYDARDQHLVTTINPLSVKAWRESFGQIYLSLIRQGLLSVMSAHIAFPAYARAQGAEGVEAYRPASVSKILNQQLLRGELGFNGLITSDASSMGGLSSWGPRENNLPEVIENGCDMILFSTDMHGDLAILTRALKDGRLSQNRVNEAVLRILALKAKVGTYKENSGKSPARHHCKDLPLPGGKEISEAISAASPTLVKDVNGVVPISVQHHRRITLVTEPVRSGFVDLPPEPLIIAQLLRDEGFEVSTYDPVRPPVAGEADLVVYLLAQESVLTKSHIYLDWVSMLGPMESAMRRTWHEIPSLLISFGQPYYLYDAPRMPCVINAYSAIEPVQRAVVRKLLGLEPFVGISPVDPYCGLSDAIY